MPTIDQLNFEVILDDKKFSTMIEKDLRMAQDLNMRLSDVLNLKKRLNSETAKQIVNAEKVKQAEQKTQQEVAKTALAQEKVKIATEKAADAQRNHSAAVQQTNASLLNTTNLMRTLTQLTGIYFGAAGVRRFLSSMIEITGQFEMQQVALRTMLRDAEAADRIFKSLYEFSSNSTYRFSELAKYAKQIAAFGVQSEDLLGTTKMIGDVAAGLGVSMDRLILAYGHVKSSGFLRGIQLRSFSQNGVPILEELSKMFTEIEGKAVSLGEVFDKMMRREIPFEMVEEAFKRMTSEGGQFYNMQENLAQTLAGQINIMKGRWENLMYEMGQQTEGLTMTIVKAISQSISSLDAFKRSLRKLAFEPIIVGLIKSIRNKGDAADAIEEGVTGTGTSGGRGGGKNEGILSYDLSGIIEGIKKTDREIKKIRSKASTGKITKEEKAALDANVEARKELTDLYKDIMGVDYDREYRGMMKAQKDATKERITDLKAEIAVLEKYKKAYEQIEPYFGEDTVSKLGEIFGTGNDYATLDAQIEGLIGELRNLGKEGNDAADSIETRLGIDAVSKILKAEKAIEAQQKKITDWEKEMRRWERDWGGGFTGSDNDIDAIVRKYNDEIKQIDDEYADALGKLQDAHEGNAEAIWEEKQKLQELVEARKKAAQNAAQESINEYSKKLVSEAKGKMDLTDWGDKSIGQVYRIWRDLKQRTEEAPILNERLRDRIYKAGLVLADFRKMTKEEWRKLEKEAKEELIKKVGQTLQMFVGLISDVVNELGELADATGNGELARFAEGFQDAADVMGAVVQGFQQGDWIGAVVAGISAVATKMIQASAEAARLNAQIREIQEESRKMRYETMLSEGVDTIFGSNTLKGIDNAKKTIEEVEKAIKKREQNEKGQFFIRTLDWMTKEIGRDLYDAYGNLNAESLQAILDKYPKLSAEGKEWITQAINDSEAYEKALAQLDEAVKSIFGDIAESVADTLVDQWIEAGNAALDYADILDDVAKSYSKMLVKSMIMEEIFSPENTEDLRKAFLGGEYEQAMTMVTGLMDQVKEMAPAIEGVLQAFDPYFSKGETDVKASSKALSSNFSQDTIDYWSGQLTLLVEYARHREESMDVMTGLVMTIRDGLAGSGDGNYTANVQTYLTAIQSDTSAMRGDIYSLKLAVQNMNEKGVKML